MRKIKKIESRTISSTFSNCEISLDGLMEILGGKEVAISCAGDGEVLKKEDHKHLCGADDKFSVSCSAGAELHAVIVIDNPVLITELCSIASSGTMVKML
jgi:hypothetical protein